MKIESNETAKSYINTEATWTHGKEITLDGVKLIPITVIEDIKAEINKKGKEDLSKCKDPRGLLKIACDYTMVLAIIDKHTKELMK